MIHSLDIQNYALIDDLHIDFDKGLNIVTGETGAGKSIMLGAMSLIMGKRADSKVLYHQNKKCIVEAKFYIKAYNMQPYFEEHDLDYQDELIIRREINANGKSRAFVNDTPTTLEVLQEVTDNLIDLHQQFDTLDIHKPHFQLSIIDALSANDDLLNQYRLEFRKYKSFEKELIEQKSKASNMAKEADFLNFQFKEFQDANLKIGEKEELESQLDLLTNAEDIKHITGLVSNRLIDGEQSLTDICISLNKELSHIAKYNSVLNDLSSRLSAATEELRDIGKETYRFHEDTEYDQKTINSITDKLNVIYKLEKKHGVSGSAALLAIQESIKKSLLGFENLDATIQKLTEELNSSLISVANLADQLHQKRINAIPNFIKQAEEKIRPLGMENAKMDVKIKEIPLSATGKDELTFYFNANKGSALKPLKDVASGGELSRVTLVVKSIITEAVNLPTMIFDEIDSGISGEVARKMANILRDLSIKHQVICITHSPQIASSGHKHYFVFKDDQQERTISSIKVLNKTERIHEIAKMLSGDPPSKSAIENAKEMLN